MMKRFSLMICTVLYASIASAQEFNPVSSWKNSDAVQTIPGFYKGAAWIDFDNDSDIDLFVSPNFLFRNDGKGVFTKLPDAIELTPHQPTGGVSWADINNDGWIDCVISQSPSAVLLNNGNGTFRNISSQIPGFENYESWGCAIGNIDNDPYLDFVFAHARGFHKKSKLPSKLYINSSPTVSASPVTGLVLTDSLKPYTIPYWSDYDLDGDMDLFVASGPGGKPGPDFQYKNMKTETGRNELKPMKSELFANQPQDGQGYSFVDVDNDRDLDLCLTNYGGALTQLYMNIAGAYVPTKVTFTAIANNLSNNWGDFDNDGDLDVIITSDTARTKYYKNKGDGTFDKPIKIGKAGGSGIANADYDEDGDLDFFIHGIDSAQALYKNSLPKGNHWINIRCTGVKAGKSALGTIVMLKAKIKGKTVWQMREINAQNSFLSQNDLRVHFGLGDAASADTIVIKYPGGVTETFTNVSANSFYTQEEGSKKLLKR